MEEFMCSFLAKRDEDFLTVIGKLMEFEECFGDINTSIDIKISHFRINSLTERITVFNTGDHWTCNIDDGKVMTRNNQVYEENDGTMLQEINTKCEPLYYIYCKN